jgi:hypothetical protein
MAGEQRKSELISAYFRERPGPTDPSVVDDRTWSDLDMDAVLAAIDRTRSSVGIAYARRFTVRPMLAVSSITNRDNLLSSQSHYFVEAKRLLDILSAARGPRPAFVIIDEILSGTNSEERIAASTRILRHLSGMNCLVVAATHDRPIAAALSGAYDNLHFTHLVEREGLQFDYRLRDGIVESGNAIRLLRLLGYPPEIWEGIGGEDRGVTSPSG